jgi:hypothetical protein
MALVEKEQVVERVEKFRCRLMNSEKNTASSVSNFVQDVNNLVRRERIETGGRFILLIASMIMS